ncbi:hypothetical protein ACWC5I_40995 [Kitasatospora sp. NPDC001574]
MLFKILMFLAASFLAFIDPMVAVIIIFVAPMVMLFAVVTIAMTAVWSRHEKRRADARKVLLVLLRYFFEQRKK